MSNKPDHLFIANKMLWLAISITLSTTLTGCGEGALTRTPETSQPKVQYLPLNDTGVTFFIDDSNLQTPVMIPRKDAKQNILSIYNNFVNESGERYTLEPLLDSNNNPVFDDQGVQRTKMVPILQNGNPVIEEVAYIQATNTDGELKFSAVPTIYTANPADFPDQSNIIASTSAPGGFPGQDANFGRDSNPATNTVFDGKAGFNFTKLSKDSGSPLLPDAEEYGCVKDEITGLTWENKVDQGLSYKSSYHELHKSTARYTWYDPDPNTNGGDAGQLESSTLCTTVTSDTFHFVEDVNAEKLCGFKDWRIPTAEELRSIVDYNVKNGDSGNPAADKKYFPFIDSILHRWTSQTSTNTERAYGFHFHEGRMQAHEKYCTPDTPDKQGTENSYHNGIVLVRGVYFTEN